MAEAPLRARNGKDVCQPLPTSGVRESVPRAPQAAAAPKRSRTTAEARGQAHWTYPPAFWDGLKKIHPSRGALRELDRRTRCGRPRPQPLCSPEQHAREQAAAQQLVHDRDRAGDLARFARHGGPDLRDLRGYRCCHAAVAMSARSEPPPGPAGGPPANAPSTLSTSLTKQSKSSAYNSEFGQHLTEYNIHPVYESQKADLAEVAAVLGQPRPSLSPSRCPDSTFKAFQKQHYLAEDEDDVMANVMPTILGPSQPEQPMARNTVFGHLVPLTDGSLVAAQPDIYYGARPAQLSRTVRQQLGHHIVPSTPRRPLAPSFFVAVKGPNGSAEVAMRQARYDGAIGARAMHSLRNYGHGGEEGAGGEPTYDRTPHTFTSIYHNGQIEMYAHHVTAPTAETAGRSAYHMTPIDSWALTGNADSFRRGVSAFRNVRGLAAQYRSGLIQAANEAETRRQAARAAAEAEAAAQAEAQLLGTEEEAAARAAERQRGDGSVEEHGAGDDEGLVYEYGESSQAAAAGKGTGRRSKHGRHASSEHADASAKHKRHRGKRR